MPVILALDQGTTSSRAIVFDHGGHVRAVAQREVEATFPRPGWVEQDPEEIWYSQYSVAIEALSRAGVRPSDVAAIGIANQRETTIVWDRETGAPIHDAIVWQDRRTAESCQRLEAGGAAAIVRERTGLIVDPYFSGTKIAWLLDNVEGARELANAGRLAFGTVDSWLLYRLTGRHVTDVTNASRTMLFDIHKGAWDDDLLALLDVPASLLPEVVASSGVLGEACVPGLDGVLVAGVAGDQQAALFGQACFEPGMSKATYGTGCFVLMHTGREAHAREGLITTVASNAGPDLQFALEGSVFTAGAVVQWLRDGLGIIRSASEVETLAASVPDTAGVYFVPAFTGLGAPYWDASARGAIVGLTRGATAAHIARAALESIAFQVADVMNVMQAADGPELRELRVDGGAARDDLLMQFQADLLGVPVLRPRVTESTALGAAYLAGLAVAFWSSAEEIAAEVEIRHRFEPEMAADQAAARYDGWKTALKRTLT